MGSLGCELTLLVSLMLRLPYGLGVTIGPPKSFAVAYCWVGLGTRVLFFGGGVTGGGEAGMMGGTNFGITVSGTTGSGTTVSGTGGGRGVLRAPKL